MDDMYGMLYSSLAPEKKLLTAVTCNMLDTLDTLLKNHEVDVNAKLSVQNGNTALHVASQKGFHGCLRRLLHAGSNPDLVNNFGFTSLALALRSQHSECVQPLLSAGGLLSDPSLIWQAEQTQGLPIWLEYKQPTVEILLIATQDFGKLPKNIVTSFCDHFFHNCANPRLIKIYFLLGNKVSDEKMRYLVMNSTPTESRWLQAFSVEPQSLQHYARLAIRRNVKCNVYYSAQHLPLPRELIQFLTSTSDLI